MAALKGASYAAIMTFSHCFFKRLWWRCAQLGMMTLWPGEALELVTVSISFPMTRVFCPLNRRSSSSASYWQWRTASHWQSNLSGISEMQEGGFLRNLQILAIFLHALVLPRLTSWMTEGLQATAEQRGSHTAHQLPGSELLAFSGQTQQSNDDGSEPQLCPF